MKKGVMALVISLSLLTCGASYAATTAKPAQPTEAAPTINEALKTKFFKAQAQQLVAVQVANQARAEAESKVEALKTVVQDMVKVCGLKYQLTMDKAADPACVLKQAGK